jgi:hypothetical protein
MATFSRRNLLIELFDRALQMTRRHLARCLLSVHAIAQMSSKEEPDQLVCPR